MAALTRAIDDKEVWYGPQLDANNKSLNALAPGVAEAASTVII